MLLTIDVGNTNIVFGLFKGKKHVKTWREETGRQALGLRRQSNIDGVIVSSVVPKLDRPLKKAVEKSFRIKPVFVTHKNIGLKIKLKRKSEVGSDRLVNAYAAKELYGGPAIIVDFGTATTFCGINKKGEYLGGAIAPGVALSAKALHSGTAKLPEIEVKYTGKVIGKSTREAMRSGLYFGYAAMVEGMIGRFRKALGKRAKVIATGGFSEVLNRHTKDFDVVDRDLTLKGLKLIWEKMNV